MTEYLQKIRVSESQYTVYVKPQLVVEVAFNDIDRAGGSAFLLGPVNTVKRSAFAVYRGFRGIKIFRQGVIQHAAAETGNL